MKNRNRLTAITGILIVLAFAAKWLFKSETAESGLLLAASLIGGFPIAASAWQALKVKVISIDLLVTLAILGAFVIRNSKNPLSWPSSSCLGLTLNKGPCPRPGQPSRNWWRWCQKPPSGRRQTATLKKLT